METLNRIATVTIQPVEIRQNASGAIRAASYANNKFCEPMGKIATINSGIKPEFIPKGDYGSGIYKVYVICEAEKK